MSVLEFLSSIVSSSAWPIAVVCLVIILKAPLGSLLGRLVTAKAYGVEVGFENAADEVRANAAAAVDEVEPEAASAFDDARQSVAVFPNDDPTFTVLSAWTRVERAVTDFARIAGVLKMNRDGRSFQSSWSLAQLLLQVGAVNEHYLRSFRGLRELRDRVAHGIQRISYDEAIAFGSAANELVRATEVLSLVFRRSTGEGEPPSPAEP